MKLATEIILVSACHRQILIPLVVLGKVTYNVDLFIHIPDMFTAFLLIYHYGYIGACQGLDNGHIGLGSCQVRC